MLKTMYEIDKEKFKAAMKKRGVSCKEASLALGYNENFFNNSVYCKGRLNRPAIFGLKQLYNIDISEIELVPDEPKEVAEAVESETPDAVKVCDQINYDDLYKVIYAACYAAFHQALIDDSNCNNDHVCKISH